VLVPVRFIEPQTVNRRRLYSPGPCRAGKTATRYNENHRARLKAPLEYFHDSRIHLEECAREKIIASIFSR